MILSSQAIRYLDLIENMVDRDKFWGVSHGLGPASYDVRAAQFGSIHPGQFMCFSTVEKVRMPHHIAARVYSKSTWARQGLLTWNTFIDPGFHGHLTIGLFNHSDRTVSIFEGMGIAQLVFEFLDQATEAPYAGKYQNQGAAPVAAKF